MAPSMSNIEIREGVLKHNTNQQTLENSILHTPTICMPVSTNLNCYIPSINKSNNHPQTIRGKLTSHQFLKIISSQVTGHFSKFNILSDAQHGLRPKKLCESQLIITIHEIAQALDRGEQTAVILLDFQKAFDKVPHKRLLAKLDHYGIRDGLNGWVYSFLSNRTQRVAIGGEQSNEINVTSGVPQGSALGPIPFSAYINDLRTKVKLKGRLFADDYILYRKIKPQSDASVLQNDLDSP